MNAPLRSLIAISGLTIGFGLTSCVDPYYADGSGYNNRAPDYAHPRHSRPSQGSGYTLRQLPRGFRTEIVGGIRYFYHNGTYYRPRGEGYVVVPAPRGSRYHGNPNTSPSGGHHNRDGYLTQLPGGTSSVIVRGIRYYQYRGRFYRPQGTGYVVVPSPY